MPEEIRDNYNPGNNYPRPSNELTKSQKIAVAVLAFFAFFIIILWGFQFRSSLTSPFNREVKQVNDAKNSVCPNGNCAEQTEADMRKKDTDKDGLNDWDELNIYNTSPYLDDSDSDGFGDKSEIDSSNDPNCPVGRDCSGVQANDLATSTIPKNETYSDQTTTNMPASDPGDAKALVDTAELRKKLIESGSIKKEDLDKISDELLLKTYKDSLNNQ